MSGAAGNPVRPRGLTTRRVGEEGGDAGIGIGRDAVRRPGDDEVDDEELAVVPKTPIGSTKYAVQL